MIPSRQPQIKITLKKVQIRKGADRISFLNDTFIDPIDLTPFLGELGSVTTSRGLDRTGIFSITLADKMDAKTQDSVYALIEPMDLIEIRMAQNPVKTIPIVMRGIVSTIERDQSIGADGHPYRSVHISGHDFSKFLQIMQISYQKGYLYGEYALSAFPLLENYGMLFNLTAAEFVTRVVEALNRFMRTMAMKTALEEVISFNIECTVKARVGPYGMATYEGTVMGLLTNWTDLGWNELFIEDRPEGVYVVYRPTPYYEARSESLIMPGAVAPESHDIQIADVETLSLSRSDGNVANFYQVDAPQAEWVDLNKLKDWALANGLELIINDRNCSPDIYGLKRMAEQTQQAPDEDYPRQQDMSKEDKARFSAWMGSWFLQRLDELKRLNHDNAILEEGSITMKGREDIRSGMYIRFGNIKSRYYVTHVTHQFMPFRLWKTTLQVSRGEGYADRINQIQLPYWGDGMKGVYE